MSLDDASTLGVCYNVHDQPLASPLVAFALSVVILILVLLIIVLVIALLGTFHWSTKLYAWGEDQRCTSKVQFPNNVECGNLGENIQPATTELPRHSHVEATFPSDTRLEHILRKNVPLEADTLRPQHSKEQADFHKCGVDVTTLIRAEVETASCSWELRLQDQLSLLRSKVEEAICRSKQFCRDADAKRSSRRELQRDATARMVSCLVVRQSPTKLPELATAKINAYIGNNDRCIGVELKEQVNRSREASWRVFYEEVLAPVAAAGCSCWQESGAIHEDRTLDRYFADTSNGCLEELALANGVACWTSTDSYSFEDTFWW